MFTTALFLAYIEGSFIYRVGWYQKLLLYNDCTLSVQKMMGTLQSARYGLSGIRAAILGYRMTAYPGQRDHADLMKNMTINSALNMN